jgi:hypothetical protein
VVVVVVVVVVVAGAARVGGWAAPQGWLKVEQRLLPSWAEQKPPEQVLRIPFTGPDMAVRVGGEDTYG